MTTQAAEIDDRIRLTAMQARVLEGVVSEHRQTHRGVPILIVQAYCNALTARDQGRVLAALADLRRLELIRVRGEAVLPAPGAMDRIQPGEPAAEAPGPRAAAGDARPPVRPPSRDTLRPVVGGAPKPVTRSEAAASRPAKACQATDCNRPALEVPNASLCGKCRERMKWPGSQPRVEYPATAERIHPEGGVAISAELLDRCAAMHLSLLEQALADYAQGDEAAGREILWLRETGRQLVAAGGGA
ncbi:hypothetical protein [Halomonas koreensis]|uniref:Uncharacterized protein n=1 Tax=Halomonas koreensis TaxID=245385 RepID=A0ABU1G2V3_9GAMM|nr:hypothetical protein [Halomonas koreensis]MDR5867280.1 hypothetical protein [Halomonas koreensis]